MPEVPTIVFPPRIVPLTADKRNRERQRERAPSAGLAAIMDAFSERQRLNEVEARAHTHAVTEPVERDVAGSSFYHFLIEELFPSRLHVYTGSEDFLILPNNRGSSVLPVCDVSWPGKYGTRSYNL